MGNTQAHAQERHSKMNTKPNLEVRTGNGNQGPITPYTLSTIERCFLMDSRTNLSKSDHHVYLRCVFTRKQPR